MNPLPSYGSWSALAFHSANPNPAIQVAARARVLHRGPGGLHQSVRSAPWITVGRWR